MLHHLKRLFFNQSMGWFVYFRSVLYMERSPKQKVFKSLPTDLKLYKSISQTVKSRVKRWPSAYASGMLVQEYKRVMAQRGLSPYVNVDVNPPNPPNQPNQPNLKNTASKANSKPLSRWFAEKWIDIKTGRPCGDARLKPDQYPTCRPSKVLTSKTPKIASALTQAEKKRMISQKKKARSKTVLYKETKRRRS